MGVIMRHVGSSRSPESTFYDLCVVGSYKTLRAGKRSGNNRENNTVATG